MRLHRVVLALSTVVLVTATAVDANPFTADGRSTPFNARGNARYFVDDIGRFVILLDEEEKGKTDGLVDHVFLYARSEPLQDKIDGTVDGAVLHYLKDRVLLTGYRGGLHVDLAIGVPRGSGRGDVMYRVVDGIELAYYPGGNTIPLSTFSTAAFGSVLLHDLGRPVDPMQCSSGGVGSDSCSLSGCSGSPSSCSVSCGSTTYACCNCGPSGASCSCLH